MKTTVDIADALAREAKKVAARENTTLRELVEAGLRSVLRERRTRTSFRLRDASFKGRGMSPEFRDGGWSAIRDVANEPRGA